MLNEASRETTTLAGRLEALVGSDRVSLGSEAAIHGMRAPVGVRPADDQQLGKVLALADSEGLAACITGGATKLDWGNRPDRFDLLINTGDMRGFSDVDADNLSLSVAAGTPVAEVRAKARAMDRLLPLDPSRPSAATVGGVTATGDQGARGAGYGGLRDVVLGLRAVLADGSSVRFGGRTMKNVTGYDMTKLFIGSFGVLGVITEVTYRLLPRPETQALIAVPLASLDHGKDIVAQILDSYLQPLALEVISSGFAHLAGVAAWAGLAGAAGAVPSDDAAPSAAADLIPGDGYLLLAGFAGHRAAVSRSVAEVRERSGVPSAAILEDVEAESFFEALSETGVGAAESGPSLTARSTVPIGSVWELARTAESRAGAIGAPLGLRIGASRGTLDLHMGEGKSHGSDRGSLTTCMTDLRREAVAMGGQFTVTRGLAMLSPHFDAWGDPDAAVQLMKRVKERFDPHRVLNPGRFVGGI
ncbi:MAG: FAD-binding oxidoreductase [bacterium]